VVSIHLISEQDEGELFEFEFKNKLYFEKYIPGRGDRYFILENFRSIFQGLLEEQQSGLSYFYVIKNEMKSIIGRINLVDIDKDKRSGNVGYRIGEVFVGKGIATKALELLLKEAVKLNILEIHAKTTHINIASQKVLEKMKFREVRIEKEAITINHEKLDFIHYMWTSH